ncbi:MAG: hypothetical protein OEO23_04795, partial [Gemmatimonadota bacterium]|nr:hypothetical protein [Gemmatimonadota bacterium]
GGEEGPSLRIRVAPTPPAVGTARILVQVGGDAAPASGSVTGRPLPDGVGVSLEAGVSGPATVSVPEFAFTRPGPWRLVAEVRLADGSVLRDSTDVRVVEGLSPAPDPPES